MVAVMPAGHALAARTAVTLQDLAGEPVIRRGRASSSRLRACGGQRHGAELHSLCCLAVRKERPLISALFAVALGGG
nr:hypothetical protein [Cupriavidus taiwanensis]